MVKRAIFPSLQTYSNIVLYTLDEGIFYNFYEVNYV